MKTLYRDNKGLHRWLFAEILLKKAGQSPNDTLFLLRAASAAKAGNRRHDPVKIRSRRLQCTISE